jgi:energy-coupling factor transporter ATP-binding protein EcfA2
VKAKALVEVIRVFDPHRPLQAEEIKTWYVDRPGNPADEIKIYLQGVALNNQPVRLLFTGHTGSGKSTELNRLSTAIKNQFFIVSFDVSRSLSIADLSYVDLVLGMATALFRRATEPDVLGKAPAQITNEVWEDIAGFIEKVIFGPASFRQPPENYELSAKVNYWPPNLKQNSAEKPALATKCANAWNLAWPR